jgi:hypothetical protein
MDEISGLDGISYLLIEQTVRLVQLLLPAKA